MEEKTRKLSPSLYILIGLITSAILGIVVTQLLLGESQAFRENRLCKYTVLFYLLTMAYTSINFFSEHCLPLLLNVFKFVGVNFLLSLPYSAILILVGDFSINILLTYLPAQLIFLAVVYFWHVACEIDPDLENHSCKIWAKMIPIIVVVMIINIIISINFGELPDVICLALYSFAGLVYSLFLLKKAKEKARKLLESNRSKQMKQILSK